MAAQVALALTERYRALRRLLRPLRARRPFRRDGDGAATLDAYLAARLGPLAQETLLCLYYDGDGAHRGEQAGTGTVCSVLPDRAAIMRGALDHGARHVVIAHNHPGGDSRPSGPDVQATRELHAMFASMGMRLHDHIVVARGGALFSFRRAGLM